MIPKKDNMHLRKRLDRKAFSAGWAGLLLVFTIIFMVTPSYNAGKHISGCTNRRCPEAENFAEQPGKGTMATIYILKDGSVSLDDWAVPNIDELPVLVRKRMAERKDLYKKKILLDADKGASYQRVTDVLDKVSKADIEIVGLITDEKLIY